MVFNQVNTVPTYTYIRFAMCVSNLSFNLSQLIMALCYHKSIVSHILIYDQRTRYS